jgi:hypothetical protein
MKNKFMFLAENSLRQFFTLLKKEERVVFKKVFNFTGGRN